jgi:hypothetical protein
MIRYSHVSLMIPCDADSAASITATLGVQPTRLLASKSNSLCGDGNWKQRLHHAWMLDSPKSHAEGNPTVRLYALADLIDPIASRLAAIRPQFRPWIDILYHTTPQHRHGVTGEFDWIQVPADLMRRYGAWDLDISYESIWFDRPDRVRPIERNWFSWIIRAIGRQWRDNAPGGDVAGAGE